MSGRPAVEAGRPLVPFTKGVKRVLPSLYLATLAACGSISTPHTPNKISPPLSFTTTSTQTDCKMLSANDFACPDGTIVGSVKPDHSLEIGAYNVDLRPDEPPVAQVHVPYSRNTQQAGLGIKDYCSVLVDFKNGTITKAIEYCELPASPTPKSRR